MSCYHPLVGLPKKELSVNGKVQYRLLPSSAVADFELIKAENSDSILIPCGKCLGCRLDYSRRWADRLMLELETSGCGMFLTLTYRTGGLFQAVPDHPVSKPGTPPGCWTEFQEIDGIDFPLWGTLSKKEVQLFMKRLRKAFPGKRIRFFFSGEYGPLNFRPHYHAIIFGISRLDLDDIEICGRNELNQPYYRSSKMERIWQDRGMVCISDVSFETCAYVSRYILKKQNGPTSIEYACRGVIPPFSLMSRKPGIGSEYYELHPDCLDYQYINISTPSGGKKLQIPKYYFKKLQFTDSEKYDKIMQDRLKYAEDRRLAVLADTDLEYLDYLQLQEKSRKQKVTQLRQRSKV